MGTSYGHIVHPPRHLKRSFLAANRSVGELVNMNGSLFFVAGDSLWKSMGPPMVRSFLLEVMSEPHKTFLQVPTISIFPLAIEGLVALAAARAMAKRWTESGTIQVKNINPRFNEGYGYGAYPSSFATSSGVVYFQAFDGRQNGIWTTDGNEAGTRIFEQSARGPVDLNGQLYYSRLDSATSTCSIASWPNDPHRSHPYGTGCRQFQSIQTCFVRWEFCISLPRMGSLARNSVGAIAMDRSKLIARYNPRPRRQPSPRDMESQNGLLYFPF